MASSNRFQGQPSPLGQLQALWRNPSAVSALASLGAHVLFFLALPFLPYAAMKAKEPEIKRSVGVVQLTPEEQKRLPDFSTSSPIELPPIAQPPKSGSSGLFSLNPPKLPASSSPPAIDPLPTLPPLPIFIPPPTQIPSYSIQIPTTPALPRITKPAPSASSRINPPPPATGESVQVPVEQGPASNQGNNSNQDNNSGAEQPNQQPNQSANQQSEQQNQKVAVSPSPRTNEQILAGLQARQAELRQLFTYSPQGTSVEDGNTAFLSWFQEAYGRPYGQDEAKPQQGKIEAEYPRLACPLKQSRSAVIGAIVDANNKLTSEPKVLQSSGYPLFNQEALKAVESYSFNNSTGNQQSYLIRVEFNYDQKNCPAGLPPANQTPPS
jgi:TonB family protein